MAEATSVPRTGAREEARGTPCYWSWEFGSGPRGSRRARSAEAERATSSRRARKALGRGALCALAAGVLSGYFEEPILAGVILGLGALHLAGGFLSRRLQDLLERGERLLVSGVGTALTWIVLTPFFYVCFGAGRLLLLVSRKDPMRRGGRGAAESHWTVRGSSERADRYRKPY